MSLRVEMTKRIDEHQVDVLCPRIRSGGIVIEIGVRIVLGIRGKNDVQVLDAWKHFVVVGLRVGPRLERVVHLDSSNASLVLGVVVEGAKINDVFLQPIIPIHDRGIVGVKGKDSVDLGEGDAVGRGVSDDAIRCGIERLFRLESEQLVFLRGIGLVRIEEDGGKDSAVDFDVRLFEMKAVCCLEDDESVGADVKPCGSVVIDDATDEAVDIQWLAVFIEDAAYLLGRIRVKLDSLALCDESMIDEKLLLVRDIQYRIVRGERRRENDEEKYRQWNGVDAMFL